MKFKQSKPGTYVSEDGRAILQEIYDGSTSRWSATVDGAWRTVAKAKKDVQARATLMLAGLMRPEDEWVKIEKEV